MSDMNFSRLVERLRRGTHKDLTEDMVMKCVRVASESRGLSIQSSINELLLQYFHHNYVNVIPTAWLNSEAVDTSATKFMKAWKTDAENGIFGIAERSDELLRVCTFNVHYWYHHDNRTFNFEKMLEDIKTIDADVVCLQEAILPKEMKSGVMIPSVDEWTMDVIKPFEDLGYMYYVGCETDNKKHIDRGSKIAFFGNAVFSKYPIVASNFLTLERFEQSRCLALAEIVFNDTIVNVVSIHLDVFDDTEATRERQIKTAMKFLKDIKGPLIVAGDFNALWRSDYTLKEWEWIARNNKGVALKDLVPPVMIENGFKEAFKTGSLKSTAWTARRVDYVWFRGGLEPKISNVFYTSSSDHFPLIVDFGVEQMSLEEKSRLGIYIPPEEEILHPVIHVSPKVTPPKRAPGLISPKLTLFGEPPSGIKPPKKLPGSLQRAPAALSLFGKTPPPLTTEPPKLLQRPPPKLLQQTPPKLLDVPFSEKRHPKKRALLEFPSDDNIITKINRGETVKGAFVELLWTHNTPYSTLYQLFRGNYKPYIRGLDDNGQLLKRGAQFRYGIDSQYGDVMFIMNKNKWWEKLRGVNMGSTGTIYSIVPNPVIGHYYRDDFLEHTEENIPKIERMMSKDAAMFDFRSSKARGNGFECQKEEWELSWCNLQLVIGDNISLEHVDLVLAPRWLVSNSSALELEDYKEFMEFLQNKLPVLPNGAPNPLHDKIMLYGPFKSEEAYQYFRYAKIDEHNLRTYYPHLDPNNYKTHGNTSRESTVTGSSSQLAISYKAFKTAEKIYMNKLVKDGMIKKEYSISEPIHIYEETKYLLYIIPNTQPPPDPQAKVYGGYHITLYSSQTLPHDFNINKLNIPIPKKGWDLPTSPVRYQSNGLPIIPINVDETINTIFTEAEKYGWNPRNRWLPLHLTLPMDKQNISKLLVTFFREKKWYLQVVRKTPKIINPRSAVDYIYEWLPNQRRPLFNA